MHTKAAILLCLFGAYPLAAATLPAGPEVVVKSGDHHFQRTPAAAIAANGQGIVVWADVNLGLRARSINPAGAMAAEVPLVANLNHPPVPGSARVTDRKDPAVVFDAKGTSFLVVWTNEIADVRLDYFFEDRQVVEQRVFGQRFDLTGRSLGEAFPISAASVGFHSRPQVARIRCGAAAVGCVEGAVVIAWQGDDLDPGSGPAEGIFARTLDPRGGLSNQARLTSPIPARNVALAADDQGSFLAVWDAPDASSRGVFARPFSSQLVPLAAKAATLNQRVVGAQDRPVAAYNPVSGQYLALWEGKTSPDRYRTFGRLLARTGLPIDNQFPVTVGNSDWEVYPTLAPTLDGGFTAVWLAYDQHFPRAIRGVELDGDGARAGEEFDISEHRPGAQARISLAAGAAGSMLSAYEGYDDRHATSINVRSLKRAQ